MKNNKICNITNIEALINNKYFVSDLAKKIDLPLILVCRTTLGTINHSLLSIELIKIKNDNTN